MWIADSARCREIDRIATEEFGLDLPNLIARAGQAAFQFCANRLKKPGRIVFLCGKGLNGADGLVAARLASESGHEVVALLAEEPSELRQETSDALRDATSAGVSVFSPNSDQFEHQLRALENFDIVVDAILGTGYRGKLNSRYSEMVKAINEADSFVLSLDCPTGLNADSGKVLDEAVLADHTLTFGLPKQGFFTGEGLNTINSWSVDDLGFPGQLLESPTGKRLVQADWLHRWVSQRWPNSNKGENGSVLVLAGSETMPGAAVLATRGALRAGAGLVTVAAPASVCQIVATHSPEALLLPLPAEPEAAARMIKDAKRRFTVGVFGPGLGQAPATATLLNSVWGSWSAPAIVDADALNFVADGMELPAAPCILTPHPGEMARLLGVSVAEVQADRYKTAKLAAMKYKATVVLKGRHSLIADTKSVIAVNPTGNSGMATGGMGDVLAGVMAAIVAQSVNPFLSAVAATFLHGAAGDVCAKDIGPVGYTASEVADAIPWTRAKLASWPD